MLRITFFDWCARVLLARFVPVLKPYWRCSCHGNVYIINTDNKRTSFKADSGTRGYGQRGQDTFQGILNADGLRSGFSGVVRPRLRVNVAIVPGYKGSIYLDLDASPLSLTSVIPIGENVSY